MKHFSFFIFSLPYVAGATQLPPSPPAQQARRTYQLGSRPLAFDEHIHIRSFQDPDETRSLSKGKQVGSHAATYGDSLQTEHSLQKKHHYLSGWTAYLAARAQVMAREGIDGPMRNDSKKLASELRKCNARIDKAWRSCFKQISDRSCNAGELLKGLTNTHTKVSQEEEFQVARAKEKKRLEARIKAFQALYAEAKHDLDEITDAFLEKSIQFHNAPWYFQERPPTKALRKVRAFIDAFAPRVIFEPRRRIFTNKRQLFIPCHMRCTQQEQQMLVEVAQASAQEAEEELAEELSRMENMAAESRTEASPREAYSVEASPQITFRTQEERSVMVIKKGLVAVLYLLQSSREVHVQRPGQILPLELIRLLLLFHGILPEESLQEPARSRELLAPIIPKFIKLSPEKLNLVQASERLI